MSSHANLPTNLIYIMFAVPGWSLAPTMLKKQVGQPTMNTDQASKGVEGTGTRKRKRSATKVLKDQINDEDMADLWEHHIEGKPRSSAVTASEKAKERPKKASIQEHVHHSGEGSNSLIEERPESHDVSGTTFVSASTDAGVDRKSSKTKRRQKQREEAVKRQEEGVAVGLEPRTTIAGFSTSSPTSCGATVAPPAPAGMPPAAALKLTPLQAAMRQKLTSARFRHLNETLYTAPSTESLNLFKVNPTFFEEYHSGFRQQVSAWPENPVEGFVQELKERGKIRALRQVDRFRASQKEGNKDEKTEGSPLPRHNGTCIVADLGCGDAMLGKDIARVGARMKIKVLSFDLYSQNPHVIKADISKLPLKDGEVNVAIFCLALMGTNWVEFIEEAWRVLHWKGELWIAEIKSRFTRGKQDRVVEHSVGKKRKPQKTTSKADDRHEQTEQLQQLAVEVDGSEGKSQTDVSAFVEVLRKRGFALQGETPIDMSNKMFVRMKFTKSLSPIKGKNKAQETKETTATGERKPKFVDEGSVDIIDERSVLKPCLYKLR